MSSSADINSQQKDPTSITNNPSMNDIIGIRAPSDLGGGR